MAMKPLADFDISITPPFVTPEAGRATTYPVQVQSIAGPANGELALDLEADDFRTDLARVRGIEPDLALRKSFGGKLFRALFRDDVERVWQRSLGRVDSSDLFDGQRIRLTINVPELALLPWELLWGGDDWGFLATAANQVLSRYLPVPEPPSLRAEGKLRLLLIVQSPDGPPPIEQAEIDSLRQAIEGLGDQVKTKLLINVQRDAIVDALQEEYHVVHFLGHGTARKLALIGGDGGPAFIDDEEFAQLFLGQRSLRLVLLNACHSSQADPQGLFTGIGPALVQKRVPAVIAMQYPFVQLTTAGQFSRAFYAALAKGQPVDIAVNAGRRALSAGDLLQSRDWSTPILYMGTRQGRILDFAQAEEPAQEESDPIRELRLAALASAEAEAGLERLAEQVNEIQLRAHRLREWFVLERTLRSLQSILDGFNVTVKKVGSPPLDTEQIDNIDMWWTQCKFQINELTGLSAQIRHVRRPLPSQADTGHPIDVDGWITGLTGLRDQIQGEVFDEILGDEEEALPGLIRILRRTSAEFIQNVDRQLSDARNAMDGEMKELADMTIRFGTGLHG